MMVGLAIVLYLIRMLTIGIATGIMFVKYNLFPHMRKWQIAIIGVCASPMIASMMNYLLGLVFIGWPSWFFYAAPFALAIAWIMQGQNRALLQSVCREGWTAFRNEITSLGRWVIVDFAVAMGFVGFLVRKYYGLALPGMAKVVVTHIAFKLALVAILIVGAFFAGKYYEYWKKSKGVIIDHILAVAFFSVIGSAVLAGGLYNAYPMIGSDRSHYELNARYFLGNRNSWEIDNYKDERYGSSFRDDHGPLWITALADPKLVADMLGVSNATRVSNFNLFWIYICYNTMLLLAARRIAGNTKAGIMAVLLFDLYFFEKNFLLLGSRDAFRFIGLLLLFLYVGTIIHSMANNHVKRMHYVFMSFCCLLSMNGHEGNVYIMLGLFLCMLFLLIVKGHVKVALLCGISALVGTLVGISKTIGIYYETGKLTSSTALAFHGTPVIESMRHSNLDSGAWDKIWGTFRLPELFMISLGIIGLIAMVVEARRHKRKELYVWGILILGMLLPLSGAMDWIGYECSRWFVAQSRYRMYFLMLFAITGSWLLVYAWSNSIAKYLCVILSVIVIGTWGYVEYQKYSLYNSREAISRQRLVKQYNSIADKVETLSDGQAFVERQPLLYYLHGTPKLLFHVYSEPLIQAKTYEEIENAMELLKVGAIILPENGNEYHDYSLLPFWDYIQEEFICVSSCDYGKYVIFFNPMYMKENAF